MKAPQTTTVGSNTLVEQPWLKVGSLGPRSRVIPLHTSIIHPTLCALALSSAWPPAATEAPDALSVLLKRKRGTHEWS